MKLMEWGFFTLTNVMLYAGTVFIPAVLKEKKK